jgi:signal transduction histidine kinase
LQRPTLVELEELLRRPLDDPELRLGFWESGSSDWVSGNGAALEPPATDDRALTEVRLAGSPAAAIVHDVELGADPELLQAAGATALLAFENAQLDSAWQQSLRDLRDASARLATAATRERRNLERDLHDGVQQGLLALRVGLQLIADQGVDDEPLRARLAPLIATLDDALDELRDLVHGIYPTRLAEAGLEPALELVVAHAGHHVELTIDGVGRYAPSIESAIYFCCREALQNALKHAGDDATIAIRLHDDGSTLAFEVRDDGRGFRPGSGRGAGLRNMQDRLALVGGHLEVVSSPGDGTVVRGTAPATRSSAG